MATIESGKPNLLEKDFCDNGHDVRDKEKSVYTRQVGSRLYIACRECLKENMARSKAKRLAEGTRSKPLKPKLIREITALLNELDEVALMKILIRFREGSGK